MNKLQEARIRQHGETLLTIFPNATERDPIKLCKKLRRIEREGAAFALRCCNGPEFASEEEQEAEHDRILNKALALLNTDTATVPVFLNQDPRGYALKIDDEWMRASVGREQFYDTPARRLHKDWGGYGILAPEIDGKP